MEHGTKLGTAVRRLDDRRRQIEAAILSDMEIGLLLDPAPGEMLLTDQHFPEDSVPCDGPRSDTGARYLVVTWQV